VAPEPEKERRMSGSGELGHLETAHWEQLQNMASRFEAAWKGADTVDLNAYLPPVGSPLRRVALHELIKTDLEARWRRGQIIGIEAYLEKFPELGNATVLSPALIYEEYRVRHLHGDKPPLGGYERRFPRQFPELKRLLSEQPLPCLSAPSTKAAEEAQGLDAQQVLRVGGGGFKMIKRIGCGGFAEVWQAETPGGFPVAIKRILRPLDHAEAQLELRALGEIKRLSHPYLLQTRDYDLLDNRLYVVMDLADCTLADRLHQCKQAGEQGIPVEELLRYMHEAAEAIDYMHGEKVHHRDIKPKNILLHKGHAKVADFGLARMVASQRLTVTGSGTAPYMAPEVWKRQVSAHSDQYSLAVSYVELRLGRLPFSGNDMYSLMMDHLEAKPNLDPLPDAEQKALRQGLSKNPADRFPNCLAFVQALEEALEAAPEPGKPARGARRRKSTIQHAPPRVADDFKTVIPSDTSTEPAPTLVPSRQTPPEQEPKWKRPPVPRGRSWLLVGLGGAVLLGLLIWKFIQPYLGDFELTPTEHVTVKAGGMTTLRIGVQRHLFDGPVRVTSVSGPEGVSVSGLIDAGADSAELTLQARSDAQLGEEPLTIRAEAEGRSARELKLHVTVEPAYWKPNWRAVPGTKQITDTTQRRFYKEIDVLLPNLTPVRFVLVPQQRDSLPKDLPTFYIMQDKVWNELYVPFATTKLKSYLSWQYWFWRFLRGTQNTRYPALGMKVFQADAFAQMLGGRLPSTQQWDKAAGYNWKDRATGPFRVPEGRPQNEDGCNWKPREIAIKRNEPMPVGEAWCDRTPYDCHDMAGNGFEWTRTVSPEQGQTVPLPAPKSGDGVYLRGARFAADLPFLFREVEKDQVGIQLYLEPDINDLVYIGFRVVLEPNEQ
jgi:serine/threonine protein kinase